MKNSFRDFFYFQKSDRRAIVALGCIAVFAIGVLMVVDRPSSQSSPSMEREAMQGVDSKPNERSEVVLQTFDPNTVDSITLIHFGLKPWKVKNFLHYREGGKVFRSAEDMGDTYGWTAEDVQRLSSYVRVGKQYEKKEKKREEREQQEEKPKYTSNKFQSLTKIDVNTADTALLRRIPGVGEIISLAIVRYRYRLGGFHSVHQLLEIKIVSPELLEWFMVSSSPNLQKLNLNKASFQALNSHPYISYEQTKALLQYIRLYGKVKDEETLMATGIFTAEEMEKLKPYITYE
jgi:DNA uptake protein ComE-like DNA-binding protein